MTLQAVSWTISLQVCGYRVTSPILSSLFPDTAIQIHSHTSYQKQVLTIRPRQEQEILELLALLPLAQLVRLELRHPLLLLPRLLLGPHITDVSFPPTPCLSLSILTISLEDKMPGEFPSDDNPYKATNIDPRVDGGKPRSPTTTTQASSSIPYHTRDSALGTSTSTGAGSLGTSHDNTGPAPSTLTSTADPAARAAQYAASSNTKVPDSTPLETTQSQYSGEQQGMMGRALGAMGLGGAASTAAGYLGYGAKGSDTTEPRDSSAIATQPGVAAQESGPPKHYRRESIPTTAYPSTDAARPIAPPVGGTLDPRRSVDQGFSGSNTDSRISNDRGIGGTPATTQGVAGSGFGLGSATSGVPRQEYSESSRVRDNIGTGGTHDSHLGRDVAAGGAAAAVTGAGIHGLQHHGRDDNLRSSAAEDARRDDTFSGGHSYTIGGHQTHQSAPIHAGSAPVDAISSRDPNYRDPSSQGTGFGSTTSPSAPMSAVAAAPSRYEGQDYRRGDDSHTGRDAALGTSAAAAAIYASSSDRDRHGTIHDAITIGTPTTTTAGGRGSIDSRHYETESTTGQSSYGTSTGYGTTASTAGDRNLRQEGDHTGRNIGLGAAAGTAAAGGAAYAEHDRHHERDLEKQREHDAKEAAKREKAQEKELEKERSHAEKEERKREKEAEKEERKHEKEVEKEEKRQQKEMDKEEKERAAVAEKREHARLADAEEDRRRREREAAAGVAAVGTTGAVEHESYEKEKKPSIFKRIFKRRKNKDTGEEEEYSSDDEEDKRRYAAAAGGDGEKRYTAAGVPIHLSGDKNRNVLGHDPRRGSGAGVVTGTSAAGTSSGFGTSDQYRDNTTGVPYDSTRDHTYGTGPSGTNTTGLTSGTTGLTSGTTGLRSGTEDRPHDSITGLPYDPSKDPTAAARLSEHEGSGLTGTGEHGILGSEPLGYVGDTRR